jgi:glutamine cyclotransferase
MCPFELHFTQGFEVLDDQEHLAVSSGWYGFSRVSLYKFDFDTCLFYKTAQEFTEPKMFGEGLTRVGDKLYQMTWREKKVLIWQIKGKYGNKLEHHSTKSLPRFHRIIQGWGIASQTKPDGSSFIWISDSSSVLKGIDPTSWKQIRELEVFD